MYLDTETVDIYLILSIFIFLPPPYLPSPCLLLPYYSSIRMV